MGGGRTGWRCINIANENVRREKTALSKVGCRQQNGSSLNLLSQIGLSTREERLLCIIMIGTELVIGGVFWMSCTTDYFILFFVCVLCVCGRLFALDGCRSSIFFFCLCLLVCFLYFLVGSTL